jgi:hypothetical protein
LTRVEAKNECADEDHQQFNRPTGQGEEMMNAKRSFLFEELKNISLERNLKILLELEKL